MRTSACPRGRVPVCLLVAWFLAATPVVGEFEPPIAITHTDIFTIDGQFIEDGVIVIVEGRIRDLGADAAIPANAEVIDATGTAAYPGFISAHDHLGIPDRERTEEQRQRLEGENPDPGERSLPQTRWANRRGIRPHFRAEEHYDPKDGALEHYRKVGFTTMLAAPRGGILGGTGIVVNLSDAPLRRVVLATDVGQHASFDPDEPGRYPRSLLGAFAQFRQVMLDTAWSIEQERYFARHPRKATRPPADPALVSLRSVLSGEVPLIFEADSEHEINRALNLAEELDVRVILSGAREAYKVVDRLTERRVPVIASLDFDEEPEYGKKVRKRGGDQQIYEPLKLRKERRRLWEEQVANVIRLHEAGVPFALSTRDFKKPSDLLGNVRLVIERGLPAEDAVAALTSTPAEILGVSDQVGFLEPGYLANIVLLSEPLENKDSKVRWVFIDGHKFDFEQKQKKPAAEPDEEAELQEENGEPESNSTPAEQAESEPEGVRVSEEPDHYPLWPCEIEADRVPPTVTGGNVLISNATVLPVSGPPMQNASVLVEDGKITGVGGNLPVTADTTIIDATGRYVMPGIIDPHSHMAISSGNEGSMSVTAEVRVADVVYNDTVAIYRALAGGVTTIHTMHGSANPIGGQNVILKLKYKRPVEQMILHDAPRTIKFALGENVKQSNFARARGRRFPNTRMGVEAVIRDALVAGRQYDAQWDDYRTRLASGRDVLRPRRDLRLEALAEVVRGDLWIHAHCYRSDEILRLMHAAEDFGIRVAVLHHVLEGYRVAPEIARHGAGASTFSNLWAYKIEAFGAIPHNAALMTESGVNVTVNSDSSNRIRRMPIEAANCIRWGDLDEQQALRLITLNAARQLGIDDRVGSIEPGKDGDLAIFNGHPLNTYSKCIMTLIDGEVFFEDERPDAVAPTSPLDWNKAADTRRPESPQDLYAIVGGTVHPVSGPPVNGGTVLIRDGRIDAVGAEVAIPVGAAVVNADGLHVYPGLIDGSGDIGLTEIGSERATRDARDIAQFGPELTAASAVHPHSEHVRVARTAGITSQLVIPSGGTISGQPALIHLDGWTADEMLVTDHVGLVMRVPSLPDRLRGDEKRNKKRREAHEESMRELKAFMKQAKLYAKAVAAAKHDPELAPERDLRLEAMIPYVRGEKPVFLTASQYKAILDAIEFAEEHELRPILVGGTEAWKLTETLKEKDIPVILGTVFDYPSSEFEQWDSVYRCAAELDQAGVRWCFASQSAAHAFNLNAMAGTAVAHGLRPSRALYGLTLGAADILGVADRLGSLEPGKAADLIVTTHPPTQAVCRVTHMFIKGRPVDLASLHTESYEKFRNRPEPDLPPQKPLAGPPSLTEQ